MIYDCKQLSDEWFALRCGSLGSSRVKDAMAGGQGKSRKTLAYQLAAESITGEKTGFNATPAMQWGIEHEDAARTYFEFEMGMKVDQVGLVVDEKFHGQHCSPDGMIGKDAILEIKCPLPATHAKYLAENRLPPEYKAQVQHQIMITGVDHAYFMSFHPAFARQLVLKITRDTEYQKDMKDKINTFMQELIVIKEKIA